MSIRTKLIALIIFPILAFLYFGVTTLRDAMATATESSTIFTLSEFATDMSNFVHECQKERGYTAGFLGSKGVNFSTELPMQRKHADEKYAVLMESIQKNPLDQISPEVAKAVSDALQMAAQIGDYRQRISAQDISTKESISYYTSMNAKFLDAIGVIAYQSSDEFLARDLAGYTNFLKSKERAGIERAVLANTFAQDSFDLGMHSKLISLISAQDNYMDAFLAISSPQAVVAYKQATEDSSFKKVEEYRQIAMDKANTGGFSVSPEAWFKTSTIRIGKLKEIEDASAEIIMDHARITKQESNATILFVSILASAVLFLTGFGSFTIIRSIVKPIRETVQAMDSIAQGDLTVRLPEGRKDELGAIANSSNQMAQSLADVIGNVIDASHEVASAATEVAANSDELSNGMFEQSSHLNQVSAAIEEMNASISEVAGKSSHADSLAKSSGDQAESGGEVVAHTVTGIEGVASLVNQSADIVGKLGEKSNQIGQIIETINDIADQTNLLALNAAIEAARAGEHGRGFAVVADEVRKLAERTTEATAEVSNSVKEIQAEALTAVDSINSCQEEMSVGVAHAKEAGSALRSIVDANLAVGTEISGIAAATEEQSAACGSISQNIEEVRGLVERSSDGVREASAAATQLSTSAENLQSLVTRFKTS